MRLKCTLISLLLSSTLVWGQNAFGPGNLVVLRVGSTDSVLSNRSREVFLDEYTTGGTLVQSIAVPHTGTDKLTLQGTSSLEGFMALSGNKAYITFGGYDLALGQGSPSSSGTDARRVLARIGKNGQLDLSTKVAGADLHANGSLRSVVSNDGSAYWTAGGTQGIRYVQHGSSQSVLVSSTVTNGRSLKIFGGQLFLAHSAGTTNPRLMAVGNGLPTETNTVKTGLPGFTTTGAYVEFVFFDQDPTEPGDDVVYIADDGTGLRKFSKVAGTWVENGVFGTGADSYRGLTSAQSGNERVLYATRRGGTTATGGGELVQLTDNAGYNATIDATVSVLATAATNTAFRGIAFTPTEEVLPLRLTHFTGSIAGGEHRLQWHTEEAREVKHFTVQLSMGQGFTNIGTVAASQASQARYSFAHVPKQHGRHLYRLQITDHDGSTYYSPVVALMATHKEAIFRVYPNPARGGQLTISHPTAGKQATIVLLQADGRVLTQQPVQQGSTQSALHIGTRSRGMYRVLYRDEKESYQTAVLLD